MASPQAVLAFLTQANARGERAALIVLTNVEGGAARGVGTMMGVTERGTWLGSLSGGCTEAALVTEAQRVIASGKAELLRIGAGSPLIDIRLPCGSGIDLLIVPDPDAEMLADAGLCLAKRRPVDLVFSRSGRIGLRADDAAEVTGWHGDDFHLRINPQLRLVIAGHGEEVTALAALTLAWGAETRVLTPDQNLAAALGSVVTLLGSPAANPALALDRWSALVMLFHDHDWETALLVQALGQQPFYIGAMGSPATHARRLEALAEAGVAPSAASRITGPIGLIPAARDPQTLALSVLAQVVAAYNLGGSAAPVG